MTFAASHAATAIASYNGCWHKTSNRLSRKLGNFITIKPIKRYIFHNIIPFWSQHCRCWCFSAKTAVYILSSRPETNIRVSSAVSHRSYETAIAIPRYHLSMSQQRATTFFVETEGPDSMAATSGVSEGIVFYLVTINVWHIQFVINT